MADFLSAFSIQNWLESCPQGYLEHTQYGHAPGEREPSVLLENPILREEALRTTVQLILGERCALAASSGLINSAPDEGSKRFLATQTLDEARHVEIFTQRLYDLGIKHADLEATISHFANPNLVKFSSVLLEKVEKRDFVAGIVGQNIVLEGLAFSVFEMMHALNQTMNPKFAATLAGTIADERRHVGFGENRIGALIRDFPDKKPSIERMQKDMSYYMLATFADSFRHNPAQAEFDKLDEDPAFAGRQATFHGMELAHMPPEELERILGDTVLKEFKIRLERMGIEYQPPLRP